MKVSVLKSVINPALNILSGVASNKGVIPVLDNILFEISENKAILTASDTEVTTSITIGVSCSQEASFCLPAKLLKDSIGKLGEQTLDFIYDDVKLLCVVRYNGGKGSFEIPVIPAIDFPKKPIVDSINSIKVSSVVLKNALGTAMPFASQDSLRPVLGGILVDNDKNKVKFVATDANKMIIIPEDSSSDATFTGIIPSKAASAIEKALSSKTEDCELSFGENHGKMTYGDSEVIFRLLEGKYPSYASIVPQNNNNVVTVSKAELLAAISRGELFESNTSSMVVLDIEFMGLTVSTQDLDYGRKMSEQIDCIGGDNLRIGFSTKNLYECVNAMPVDKVMIACSERNKPAVITVENDDIKTIVMPVVTKT